MDFGSKSGRCKLVYVHRDHMFPDPTPTLGVKERFLQIESGKHRVRCGQGASETSDLSLDGIVQQFVN